MITVEEFFFPEQQSVRVVLRNPLGHVVHDMTLPLIVTVEKDGQFQHLPFDVDGKIQEQIDFHSARHRAFMEQAAKRGHVKPEDCGCGG
ncbi:MAG TPA: hypothetical protein VI636_09780 [Candidatus Angelobacter sp.]